MSTTIADGNKRNFGVFTKGTRDWRETHELWVALPIETAVAIANALERAKRQADIWGDEQLLLDFDSTLETLANWHIVSDEEGARYCQERHDDRSRQ